MTKPATTPAPGPASDSGRGWRRAQRTPGPAPASGPTRESGSGSTSGSGSRRRSGSRRGGRSRSRGEARDDGSGSPERAERTERSERAERSDGRDRSDRPDADPSARNAPRIRASRPTGRAATTRTSRSAPGARRRRRGGRGRRRRNHEGDFPGGAVTPETVTPTAAIWPGGRPRPTTRNRGEARGMSLKVDYPLVRKRTCKRLRRLLATVVDLQTTLSVLDGTSRPRCPGGLRRAGRAGGDAARITHEHAIDARIGRLLERLDSQLDPETVDGALVRIARRDYDRAVCLPADLVEETARATSLAEPAWVEARAVAEWPRFAPHLERIVALRRRAAEAYGFTEHPLDPLIDLRAGDDPARLERLFAPMTARLIPLVRAVADAADDRDRCSTAPTTRPPRRPSGGPWSGASATTGPAAARTGRDPFCTSFGIDDVRITTRFEPDFLPRRCSARCTKRGTACTSRGSARSSRARARRRRLHGRPRVQSRLWENLVGRSRPLWRAFYPKSRRSSPSGWARSIRRPSTGRSTARRRARSGSRPMS